MKISFFLIFLYLITACTADTDKERQYQDFMDRIISIEKKYSVEPQVKNMQRIELVDVVSNTKSDLGAVRAYERDGSLEKFRKNLSHIEKFTNVIIFTDIMKMRLILGNENPFVLGAYMELLSSGFNPASLEYGSYPIFDIVLRDYGDLYEKSIPFLRKENFDEHEVIDIALYRCERNILIFYKGNEYLKERAYYLEIMGNLYADTKGMKAQCYKVYDELKK
jgi:hypothetical protein